MCVLHWKVSELGEVGQKLREVEGSQAVPHSHPAQRLPLTKQNLEKMAKMIMESLCT